VPPSSGSNAIKVFCIRSNDKMRDRFFFALTVINVLKVTRCVNSLWISQCKTLVVCTNCAYQSANEMQRYAPQAL
jgi:hypothetical protein